MNTILLVDDLKLFLELEKRFLEHTNAKIFTAETARQALEILSKEKIDLLFLDYLLPDMNGTECLRIIRSNEKTKKLPVILVSSAENKDICSASGCDGFLTKPLDKEKFLEITSRFLPIMTRKDERLAINLKVSYTYRDKTYRSVTSDLSRSGLFINTTPPPVLSQGDTVLIEMKLPSKWGMEHFQAEGTIMSLFDSADSTRGLGIKFSKIDD